MTRAKYNTPASAPPAFVSYEGWKAKLEFYLSEAADAAANGCCVDEVTGLVGNAVTCLRHPHPCLRRNQGCELLALAQKLENMSDAFERDMEPVTPVALVACCSQTRAAVVLG